MAITTRDIPALPDQVWAVLADPLRYAEWVVGAQEVRCFDGEWPEPGARFHHRVGLGPVHIHDDTSVLESTPPRRLVLRARVRPFGHARVALELFACEAGTRVEIDEEPTSPAARVGRKVLDPFIHLRNVEALRRLERLVCPVAP